MPAGSNAKDDIAEVKLGSTAAKGTRDGVAAKDIDLRRIGQSGAEFGTARRGPGRARSVWCVTPTGIVEAL
jgi:hypothetical protein